MRSREPLTYGRIRARAKLARGSAVVSSLVTIYTPWPFTTSASIRPADDWNELDIECLLTIWASGSSGWAGPVGDETDGASAVYDWIERERRGGQARTAIDGGDERHRQRLSSGSR